MLTNGFALFKGRDAPSMARDAARSARRYANAVLVGTDGEFREPESSRLSGREEVALAFSLGGDGFPLVHGFRGDPAARDGEFALLGEDAGGFYGARDALGTRGLWVVKKGEAAGSMASDYRMLRGAALLPPGMVYRGGRSGRTTARREKGAPPLSFEGAAKQLASLVDESVRERVEGKGRVAVSFSGGLDSSLLALLAARHAEVVLCSAYASGSRDESQAEKAAGLLGLKLEAKVLDEEWIRRVSRGAELPPGEATVMDKALWCIYATTSALAKRSKARTILLGQLADELFGGYMKYAMAARDEGAAAAERMMRADARACADRGFLRDEAACSASCEVRFPYACEGIASFAAMLPMGYKIRDGERKAVLRAAALDLGLPEELAAAPKKAAQFSSGAAKLLKRI